MIWRYRFYLSSNKKALAKFVKCINWQVSSQASQAMELIHQWAPMDVADALELLGPTFTDQGLRQYAVNRMREAPDSELQLYLLQLVQVWDTNNLCNEMKPSTIQCSIGQSLSSFGGKMSDFLLRKSNVVAYFFL